MHVLTERLAQQDEQPAVEDDEAGAARPSISAPVQPLEALEKLHMARVRSTHLVHMHTPCKASTASEVLIMFSLFFVLDVRNHGSPLRLADPQHSYRCEILDYWVGRQ